MTVFTACFLLSLFSTFRAFAATNIFKIQNIELTNISATAEGSVVNYSDSSITSNVVFHKLNDSAKYVITLKNTDDEERIIESITDNNSNSYLSYEYDPHTDFSVGAGESFNLNVTVKYANAVSNISERAQATNVKFSIKIYGTEEPDEVIIVPDTSGDITNAKAADSVRVSLISLVISAVSLTIIGITLIRKKKHSKIIAIVIAVASVSTLATTVKAASIEINSFNIVASYGLYDKIVVTYEDGEGNTHEQVIDYGDKVSLEEPEKEGYTFNGWECESGEPFDINSSISDDIAIRPKWTKNTYTISYDAKGGEGTMENTTCTYDEECTLRSNVFTKTGHTFAGWKHGDNNYTNGQKVTNLATSGTVTLDAKWTKNTYTISFNNNEGEGSMADLSMTYSEAKHLTKNTFIRTGYTFAGWNTQANGEGTNYDDEQEVNNLTTENNATITLYAKWTKNEGTLVCKAAEELHTQPCEATGSCNGLTNADISGGTITNINNVNTITYGYYPSNSLKAGDAYTCDVNNDGVFNEANERFYYLANDGENARLVYYSGYNNGPDISYSDIYTDALTKLPTSTQWTNPNLVAFADGSLTSFPFVDDVMAACGNNVITGNVKSCIYLIENTTFSRSKVSDDVGPRSGIWLNVYNDTYYRVQSSTLKIEQPSTNNNSKNTARPVIQVPLSLMEIPEGAIDAVALVNGEYKDTLQEAINAAPNNTKTTVKLLKNITETITIGSDKNIELDLNEFAVTNSDTNTIINNGILKIKNGTVADSSTSGTIDTHSGSTLIISDNTTIQATGSKQAIYNNGGTVVIDGENIVLTSTSSNRATVHTLINKNTNIAGITYIKSGTITSTGAYAVFNEGGTTIIGEKDNEINLSAPIITGKTYGIIAAAEYEFYDGVIKGKTYANGIASVSGTNVTVSEDADNTKVSTVEDNSIIVKETVSNYKTMFLQKTSDYHITFDGNGGEPSEVGRIVTPGSSLGTLPTAEYPRFNFLGWFTDKNNGEEVTAETEPSGETTDITYFAHWEAIPQDEIVSFYTPSKAAKGYFNNINSWSENIVYTPYVSQGYTPTSSMITFWGNLKTNYEENDCNNSDILDISSDFSNYTYTSGTVKCDQPRTFDTGVDGKVNVYLSDESTKVKGALVSYTKSNNGKITNMIPGTTYYWESDADSSVYGYVKATGERRFLNIGTIRNARDLGGLTTSDNKKIKYGILIRGDKLRNNAANATELGDLGITKEYDLRGESAGDAKMSNYVDIRTRQYHFNYPYSDPTDTTELGYYNDTRTAFESLMRDVVAGEKIYFHCTYGADRTGTIAYLVETILDVDYDQRVKDYELTTLAGEADRTRIYDHKVGSGFFGENKFVYMIDFISTKKDAEDWFKAGLATETERDEADALIASFRAKMLE